MGAPLFAPSAESIFQQDAREWKRRALAAEAKLSGYRRLREIGEEVLRSVCERDAAAKARAIDAMSEELATLDIVDGQRDVYSQTIELGEKRIEVRLRAGVGHCSAMDVDKGLIEIEALQPEEGKAIGLFFQMVQLCDIAVSLHRSEPTRMDDEYLHAFAPSILALCLELGLLGAPLDRITPSSLQAHLQTIMELASKDAASEVKG